MSKIRVLFLGLGNPIPTFILNRLIQIDRARKIFSYISVPIRCCNKPDIKNGIKLNEYPEKTALYIKVISLLGYSFMYPLSIIRLWSSLRALPFKIRFSVLLKHHSLARIKNVDIIHVQWIPASSEVRWLKKYFKAPVIISARGSQITVYPETSEEYRFKLKEALIATDYIHAVSKSMADACIQYGADPEKIFVNYNGVDIEKFMFCKKRSGKNNALKLISTGALMWRKGYLWQFIVVKELIEQGINAELKIIGDGPDRQGLEYILVRLNLQKSVKLLGKIDHDQVVNYLSEADIYISTSAAEGLSNAVLEAVACGLPVIAFNCEGMNEVIKDGYNGFIVPFGDIKSMAEKIRNLYNNRQMLETMGSNGALIAKEKFDCRKQVQKMLEFYKSVCK